MEFGDLKYDRHDHKRVVDRLFKINNDLKLFSKEVGQFSIHEMAQRVIPITLKTATRLRFYDKGGKDLRDNNKIIEL
jgi:hypothetical protein